MLKYLPKVVFQSQKPAQLRNHVTSRSICSSKAYHKAFLNDVTVVGGGHMGRGIAQVSAAAGNVVTIADINESALQDSRKKIEQRLTKGLHKRYKGDDSKVKTELDAVLKRINFTTDIGGSVKKCDLVVEAIPENLELKHKLLSELDKKAPKSAIFVTNTSSLLVREICEHLSPSRKEQFGGVHFFDAVTMKLVEVIRTPETSEDSYRKMIEWSQFIGKVPVTCKDTPGFIANRLNIPYFMDAILMYERGDASMRDIDIAMKLGAGYPYGPFELADHIGLDVSFMICKGFEKRFPGDIRFRCPQTLQRLYEQGKFGAKTGEGFYKYTK